MVALFFKSAARSEKDMSEGLLSLGVVCCIEENLWLPIQCYIKILWRMFSVKTVSTEESLKVVTAEVLTEQLNFQDFISDPRVKHGLDRDNSGLPPFLWCWGCSINLPSKSLNDRDTDTPSEKEFSKVVQSPFLWPIREEGRCSRLKKWRRDRERYL